MRKSSKLFTIVALLASLVLTVGVAQADQVYSSAHVSLARVGGDPLRSGFVENIHANGPNVYAHEQYAVNGALPDAAYTVSLHLYPTSTDCTGTPVAIETATIMTNAAGNGTAYKVFVPADLPPTLHGATVSGIWELTRNGAAEYRTACAVVTLD